MLGQRLVTLMDGEQSAGLHQARWDGTDGADAPVVVTGRHMVAYTVGGHGLRLQPHAGHGRR